jgi:hypothetical protein
MEQKSEQVMREDPRAWNDNRGRLPVAPAKVTAAAKEAGFREKLREARLSKKVVFGLMMAAAVLTMLVGFNWGGWVTGGSAQKSAATGAQADVVLRLAPICVAQFNQDPGKAVKLAELRAITSSWEQPNYVEKQGWATMPGEKAPDSDVAGACAKLLIAS